MHSYAIFTTKRGRPKSSPVVLNAQPVTNLDVITSLFYLKKLSREQVDAAQYYEKLCKRYYQYIEAPSCNSTYLIDLTKSRCVYHPTEADAELSRQWARLKSEINKIDCECESLMHKVIIENKLKYELLNPVSISKNPLTVLKLGLDRVSNMMV